MWLFSQHSPLACLLEVWHEEPMEHSLQPSVLVACAEKSGSIAFLHETIQTNLNWAFVASPFLRPSLQMVVLMVLSAQQASWPPGLEWTVKEPEAPVGLTSDGGKLELILNTLRQTVGS